MGGVQQDNNWHTDSVGNSSFSYGFGNKAKGSYSIAMGKETIASGANSTAIGIYNTASGIHSTALGSNSTASGFRSIVLGENNVASSQSATAIGQYSAATGFSSTAIGSRNIASGYYSLAMGDGNHATGQYSTSMGLATTASGFGSTAMGFLTIAKGYASTVVGLYNDSLLTTNEEFSSPNTPLFIIGNGSNNANRSNAIVVYKSGNVDINGNLKIDNGTSVWSSIPTGFAANRTTTLSVPPSTFTDVLFTTQSADDGGDNYDPATGEFTAPTAGMYRFEASVYWNAGIAGFENIYFYVNGVTRRFHSIVSANTSAHTLPFTASFKLTAGDIVKVVAYHTNATAVGISANANGTYFTGVKVY